MRVGKYLLILLCSAMSAPGPRPAGDDLQPELCDSDGMCSAMSSDCESLPDGEPGEFTEVTSSHRKPKRLREKSLDLTQDISPVKPQPILKLQIIPIIQDKTFRGANPIHIAREINKITGMVKGVSKQGRSLVVECFNSKQCSQLSEITELLKTQVKVTTFSPTVESRGVIKGIDIEIKDEEVKIALELYGVVQAKRIIKRIKGESTPMKVIILTFKTKSIPNEVSLGYEKKRVYEYQQQVSRCFRCQRYGHAAGSCGAAERCPSCGEKHNWETCPNKGKPKCANCGGGHSAAYLGCPSYKKAKNIQEIKNKEKLSFADAAKKYIKQDKLNSQPETSGPLPPTADRAPNGETQFPPSQEGRPSDKQRIPPPKTSFFPRREPADVARHPADKENPPQETLPRPEPAELNRQTPSSAAAQNVPHTDLNNEYILKSVITERFIAFLAFIINNFTENMSKSNRLQLICHSADIICGISLQPTSVQTILNDCATQK